MQEKLNSTEDIKLSREMKEAYTKNS